jgi:hypothetical protein
MKLMRYLSSCKLVDSSFANSCALSFTAYVITSLCCNFYCSEIVVAAAREKKKDF